MLKAEDFLGKLAFHEIFSRNEILSGHRPCYFWRGLMEGAEALSAAQFDVGWNTIGQLGVRIIIAETFTQLIRHFIEEPCSIPIPT